MVGSQVGDTSAGSPPWTDLNGDHWSVLWKFGYAGGDESDLGSGNHRVALCRADRCFDRQRALPRFPREIGTAFALGWFGCFGFGDSDVSHGASAQVATGFVIQAPFKHLLAQRTGNDILGARFVWSRSSMTTKTADHENEYTLETKYALQLAPRIRLQPDFQMIWNPAYNPNTNQATMFQIQLALAW